MQPLAPRDVAALFAPLHQQLIALLRGLHAGQWELPTVAGAWRVRDVAAHLLDTQLRKLSGHRDAHSFDAGEPPKSYDDVLRLINHLNATGVEFGRRLSTRVLTEMLAVTGAEVAEFIVTIDPHAPARFGVAWAGEAQSQNWMDTGREYTEWWHHQMQIRVAVDAPRTLLEDRWLEPLLDFSVRALPHAYRSVDAREGTLLTLAVGSFAWTLEREGAEWQLYRGKADDASASIRIPADSAWRLFYNALPADVARASVVIEGDAALAEPLFKARSVMV